MKPALRHGPWVIAVSVANTAIGAALMGQGSMAGLALVIAAAATIGFQLAAIIGALKQS